MSLLVPLGAAALTAVLCLLLFGPARRLGWLDHPDDRKSHAAPTPLVGGVAVFLSFFSFLALAQAADWALAVACALAMLCGLVDDRHNLRPVTRFAWQALACLVMIAWGGVVLRDFGNLMWDGLFGLGIMAVPVTVFAALGVINAFNMIDGVDGLSGTVFIICALAMGALASIAGQSGAAGMIWLAAAAVFGFLLLNARFPWNARARVFLGDSGTTWLGLLLAWMAIELGNGDDRAFAPMTAVWIFGLPLLDTTRLIGSRWLRGGSALAADQQHLHHAFLRAGFSVRQTWALISLGCLAFASTGLWLESLAVPEFVRFYLYVAVGAGYLMWLGRAWRKGRFLGRPMT